MNYKEIFDERGALYNEAHRIAPFARELEKDAMLRWLAPRENEVIVVTAAGGGFDAVAIESEVASNNLRIVCVEPSPIFSEFIPEHMEVAHTQLDSIPLPDASADAILNLAALHHLENREKVFAEWVRVLKPGGRIVIGDVMKSRGNASFLNETVNAYTPGGHDGVFLEEGYLSEMFAPFRLENEKEGLEAYSWNFGDESEMIEFSRLIFGMVKADRAQILEGIRMYLNPSKVATGDAMSYEWSLLFYQANKPLLS